jgi:DNA-binding CsgD family transcriptional regulator
VAIRRTAYFSATVNLRRTDLEAILGFLDEVSQIEIEEPYPVEVVALLQRLVPSDDVAYQEVDLRARRFRLLVGPGPDAGAGDAEEDLYWVLGPCPIMEHRSGTGDLSAVRMSDLIDRRRYHELPIYRDYFAPGDVEHAVDLGLPSAAGAYRSFILFRRKGEHDFSERDRAMLDVLRPHFARIEAEAALRRRLTEVLRAREEALQAPSPQVGLTAREREIVDLVAQGKTNAQIAAELWVAPSTVKKHLEHVYEKLGIGRRSAAAMFARPLR